MDSSQTECLRQSNLTSFSCFQLHFLWLEYPVIHRLRDGHVECSECLGARLELQ